MNRITNKGLRIMICFRSVFFVIIIFFLKIIILADSPMQIIKISPEVNKLLGVDNKSRYLIFYDGLKENKDILVIDGDKLTDRMIEFNASDYMEYKYSPIFDENYLFRNNLGWVSLELKNGELYEVVLERSGNSRNKLPDKLFRSDLENLDFNYSFHDGEEYYSIVKHDSSFDEIVWSFQGAISSDFHEDFYWLGDSKLLKWLNQPILRSSDQSSFPKIVDFYLNAEDDAFEDNIIIGYGKSCIITTSNKMNSIRIYSLNRELLYSLDSIDILYPTKCSFNEQGGSIKIAYYRYPFIIVQLLHPGGFCGFGETFLIIDVEKNIGIEPNTTDHTYLMGVFTERNDVLLD